MTSIASGPKGTGNSALGRRGRGTALILELRGTNEDVPFTGMGGGSGRATIASRNPADPLITHRPLEVAFPTSSSQRRGPGTSTWQSRHRTQVVPLFCGLGAQRKVGRSRGGFLKSRAPPPGNSGIQAPRRRRLRAWCVERGAESTWGPTPPNSTGPLTIVLAKAQALLLLFFFISLFHIHISHSMEKPERVRQRWYNRSAVTGAGRGGAERGQTGWLPTCIPLGH